MNSTSSVSHVTLPNPERWSIDQDSQSTSQQPFHATMTLHSHRVEYIVRHCSTTGTQLAISFSQRVESPDLVNSILYVGPHCGHQLPAPRSELWSFRTFSETRKDSRNIRSYTIFAGNWVSFLLGALSLGKPSPRGPQRTFGLTKSESSLHPPSSQGFGRDETLARLLSSAWNSGSSYLKHSVSS